VSRSKSQAVITASALAVIAASVLSTLSISGAQAQQANGHWFYGQWGQYDERAYDDRYAPRYNDQRQYYEQEEDGYFMGLRNRRLRMQRWLARRRGFTPRKVPATVPRTFQDEFESGLPSPRDIARSPERQRLTPRPRVRLSYVPLPRKKPGFLSRHSLPARKSSLPVKNSEIVIAKLPELDSKAGLAVVESFKKPVTKTAPRRSDPVETASIPEIDPIGKAPEIARVRTQRKPETTKVAVAKSEPKKFITKTPEIKKIKKPKNRKRIQIEVKPKQRTPAGAISCKKAQSIVRDFGFSNIQTKNCSGNVYSFSASRDGKPFSVKLSSLSGELKDIKQSN